MIDRKNLRTWSATSLAFWAMALILYSAPEMQGAGALWSLLLLGLFLTIAPGVGSREGIATREGGSLDTCVWDTASVAVGSAREHNEAVELGALRSGPRNSREENSQRTIEHTGQGDTRPVGDGGLTDKGLLSPLQHFSSLVQGQLCPTGHGLAGPGEVAQGIGTRPLQHQAKSSHQQ